MQTLNLTVTDIAAESPSIRSLRLSAANGAALPAFAAGAHLKIDVPGVGERCYSLLNLTPDGTTAPDGYLLGIRLEDASRGGSRYMHGLSVGATLTATGPKNDFPLLGREHDAPGKPVVLLAGGIGITPIAAMAAELKAAGRPFVLHYSGRALADLAFTKELAALCGDALTLYGDDTPDRALNLDALLAPLSPRQHIYLCGPKGMIDALAAKAKALGWPQDAIHFELFADATAQAGDRPFEVELRQSGKVLRVPADKTILDVMIAEGCDPLFDCKRGECGVCEATVLEGEPDHRDYYLSDAEKQSGKVIQTCISRAKSARLVLDL